MNNFLVPYDSGSSVSGVGKLCCGGVGPNEYFSPGPLIGDGADWSPSNRMDGIWTFLRRTTGFRDARAALLRVGFDRGLAGDTVDPALAAAVRVRRGRVVVLVFLFSGASINFP